MLKALVGTDAGFLMLETVEYQGGRWLVPHWLADHARGVRIPIRIVRMDSLEHQAVQFGEAAFVLSSPVPKAVLDGVAREVAGVRYEVVESPDIQVPLTTKNH